VAGWLDKLDQLGKGMVAMLGDGMVAKLGEGMLA